MSQPAGKPASSSAPTGASGGDGPHISRSVGKRGGVVVFWPRVIPRSDDAAIRKLAGELQKRVVGVARSALGSREIDVRPEPERVCPRSGCAAITAGVLLVHGRGGCTALALVSGSGPAPTRIVPWAGVVQLKSDTVPFREYPESLVTVNDAVPCGKLLDSLAKRETEVAAALKNAAAKE